MKKFVSIILVLAMVFSFGINAFAAEVIQGVTGSNSADSPVDIVVHNNESTAIIYRIEVTWGTLAFTYHLNENLGVWDPLSHEYSQSAIDKGWHEESGDDTVSNFGNTITRANAVTVMNHSNAAIVVTAEYGQTGNNGYTADIYKSGSDNTSDNTINLPTAEEKAVDAAELKAVYDISLTVDPEQLPDTNMDATTVGTVTVTITAPTP